MSILIENLLKNYSDEKDTNSLSCIDNKWYISKCYPFYSIGAYLCRWKDAWRVINDKSRAYRYKEDK